jgi:plasmid stabilization system protein ParE
VSIRILSSACRDLTAGQEFYERQGEGLGTYFLDSLCADIDSLALYAGVHAQVFGFYRLLAKRFPYAVYYRMDDEGNAVVYRVLDCRQNPTKTERQLRGSTGT